MCFGVEHQCLEPEYCGVTGIRGYLDPRTGIFHSMPHPDLQEADIPPPAAFGGKFVFNFTIAIVDSREHGENSVRSVSLSLEDVATLNFISGTASVTATRSGSTATWSISVPANGATTTETITPTI